MGISPSAPGSYRKGDSNIPQRHRPNQFSDPWMKGPAREITGWICERRIS